jgi:hypothetical protein
LHSKSENDSEALQQSYCICEHEFDRKDMAFSAQWVLLTDILSSIIASILFLIYKQISRSDEVLAAFFTSFFVKIFFITLIIIGVVSWLFTKARASNHLALIELREQS